jgi:non-ribosomal peptide synthetase component F
LTDLNEQLAELRHYEHTPLMEVIGWSDLRRGLPLFESMFVFENYPVDRSLGSSHASLRVGDVRLRERTNHQLAVLAGSGERLSVRVCYDRRRFDDAAMARVARHLRALVEGMAEEPERRLSQVPMLSEEEIGRGLERPRESLKGEGGIEAVNGSPPADSEIEETIL